MSVIFDCIWWWRREFGGVQDRIQPSQKPPGEQTSLFVDGQPGTTPPNLLQGATWEPVFSDEFLIDPPLGYDRYPDWDWNLMPTFDGMGELGQSAYNDYFPISSIVN